MRVLFVLTVLVALSVLNSCSNDEARARVSLDKDSLLTRDMLTVMLSDGRSIWLFGRTNFVQHPQALGLWATPEIETKTSGTLTLNFTITDGRGKTLASGSAFTSLRRDWGWEFIFYRANENPALTCFGCFGSRVFVFSDSTLVESGDSLYVIWGGNSISNPVVY